MTLENYINEAPLLNDKFAKRYEQLYKKTPLKDGIYSPQIYFEINRVKVCVVLKEINGTNNDNWNPVEEVDNEYCIYAHKNNKPATNIVKAFRSTALCQKKIIDKRELETIPGIAYINLSKLPGLSTTNIKTLKSIVQNTKDLIIEQFELIDADIYIFGGTFNYVWSILSNKAVWPYLLESSKNDRKINDEKLSKLSFYQYYLNGKKKMLVQTYHPSRRSDIWDNLGTRILNTYNDFINDKLISKSNW